MYTSQMRNTEPMCSFLTVTHTYIAAVLRCGRCHVCDIPSAISRRRCRCVDQCIPCGSRMCWSQWTDWCGATSLQSAPPSQSSVASLPPATLALAVVDRPDLAHGEQPPAALLPRTLNARGEHEEMSVDLTSTFANPSFTNKRTIESATSFPGGCGDFQKVHIDSVFFILRCVHFGKHVSHMGEGSRKR